MDGVGLGAALRAQRVAVGLTQEQLAGRSGLSVRAIGDLERGKVARPHRESVRLLAEALGLDGDGHEELMRLAGHASPMSAPEPVRFPLESVDAAAEDPAPFVPAELAAASEPAADSPSEEEEVRAEGAPGPTPVASVRVGRAVAVAAITGAAVCLTVFATAFWRALVRSWGTAGLLRFRREVVGDD
ncbi:helix-turn-helix transcriptional regulator [Streptomyces sp. NPDC020096]